MSRMFLGSLAATLLLAASSTLAQAPVFPDPSPEHELLKRFVGHWESSSECDGGPGDEPMVNRGTLHGRMLGERWVVNEIEVDAGGMQIVGLQTIGYDPRRKKYVGTWSDSMQNQLWVYEGDYDPETRTLSLDAEGPNLMGDGEMTLFRDSFEFVSDDEIISRSAAIGEDGEWVVFMEGRAKRVDEQ